MPGLALQPGDSAARLIDALRGGKRGREAEREAAAAIEGRWPGTGSQLRAAAAWHAGAAGRAVTAREAPGWPAARSVIFAGCGYPPSGYRGARLPHGEAAWRAPAARFAYCDADEAITLLWHRWLRLDSRALAFQAPAADPRQAAGMARTAQMEEPWSVQLQLCAHWWPPEVAAGVVAGWAEVLPPGSSLVLSVPVPGAVNPNGEAGAIVAGAAGTVPFRHREDDIAGWVTGAGMRLGPQGVTDVREPGGPGWAHEALGAGLASRVAGAVGLRP